MSRRDAVLRGLENGVFPTFPTSSLVAHAFKVDLAKKAYNVFLTLPPHSDTTMEIATHLTQGEFDDATMEALLQEPSLGSMVFGSIFMCLRQETLRRILSRIIEDSTSPDNTGLVEMILGGRDWTPANK